MMKILILGGTRFFGKRLVDQLIQDGHEVTILTRGNATDTFGDCIKRLRADRTDAVALKKALNDSSFDMVYDNICYTPQDAMTAVQLFDGRVGKYIVTSTLSVYPFGGEAKKESDFDSQGYPIPDVFPPKGDYAEGKRLVEAVFFQKASFPVVAPRFPIVLGNDDYTRRLHFHVEHVQQGLPIGVPNLDARMSFIRSDEAASLLAWLGKIDLVGPVNASSNGDLSIGQIITLIEQAIGKRAVVTNLTVDNQHMSPFGIPETWVMDTTKAQTNGFTFLQLQDWLPRLIEEIVKQIS